MKNFSKKFSNRFFGLLNLSLIKFRIIYQDEEGINFNTWNKQKIGSEFLY